MKRLSTLLLVLALSVVGGILYYTFYSPYLISAEEAKKMIRDKKVDVVVDVRSKMEYNLGHYPEALHIPTQALQDQVETLIPDKNTRILIYCNTGQRARYATDVLKAKGYKNVQFIAGSYLGLTR
jgi:rhodanese-related sulfurtransferase